MYKLLKAVIVRCLQKFHLEEGKGEVFWQDIFKFPFESFPG